MENGYNYIQEKNIDGAITSIQGETLEKINEQMKNCSCIIECIEKGAGSGFFSLIPFPNKTYLVPVLITNNHILPKKDIIKGQKINIYMKEKKFSILIDDSRRIFTDKYYDITIIEMNKNDGLDFNKFLEIDDSIHKEDFKEYFKNRSIYLIHHPKSKEDPEFAVGVIKYISLDNNVINHTCKSEPGSSGSPILDLKTNKIIGIHKGSAINQNLNVGTFIKEPIEKFYQKCGDKIKSDEIINGNLKKENEIKNINNNSQNQDNFFNGKNNKSELNAINKIQIINDKVNNDISDDENEFSIFSKDNQNYKKDNLIKDNKYKDNVENNNIVLKNDIVFNKNMKNDEHKMINNNKIDDLDNEINNNFNHNKMQNLNYYIPNEVEKKNPKIIDEITIKYIKKKVNVIDLLLKIQSYSLKETISSDKLFGEYFVEINKYFCKIIIGNKEYDLKSYLNKECDEVNKNEFEIKLKGISKVTNLASMFCGCISLVSIEGFSNINTSKITRLSHLFSFCKITSIPDISKWDTSNVEGLNCMFLHCFHLKYLPDISNWNTSKVKSINNLFTDCRSLEYIPDISKWETKNLEYMAGLFAGCNSLKFLPDISNWKTKKIKSLKAVFAECKYLSNLPDISKWDTSNVTDMSSLFEGCKSLEFLPDISEWNTSKVTNMSKMFYNCKSLVFLPDISKWITFNVEDMNSMFSYCENLIELPDISKWNITNVKSKTNMFFNCNKNLNIPEKFKLNMFSNLIGIYTDTIKDAFNLIKK